MSMAPAAYARRVARRHAALGGFLVLAIPFIAYAVSHEPEYSPRLLILPQDAPSWIWILSTVCALELVQHAWRKVGVLDG